jgi:hypothetical protein
VGREEEGLKHKIAAKPTAAEEEWTVKSMVIGPGEERRMR